MVADTERATPASETGQIYDLMPKVMASIGAIGKKGWNPHDKYNFRSIDNVYDALHKPLAEHGVFFVPEVIERDAKEKQSRNNTAMTHTTLTVRYTFYAPDGSHFSSTTVGEAIDRSDKSCNKAMVAALKYLLLQVFCIPVTDVDDADNETPEAAPSANQEQGGNSSGGDQKQEGHYQGLITEVEEDRRDKYTIYKVHTRTASGKTGSINTTDDDAGKQAREHAGTGVEVVIHWYRNTKGWPTLKAVEPVEAEPSDARPSNEQIEQEAEVAF